MAVTVAPGVEWLWMPLPFALNHINLWLLADGEGYAAIDTGFALDPIKDAWKSVLARRPEGSALGARRLTRSIVTHCHPDTSASRPGWNRKPEPACGSPRANTWQRT